MDKAEARQLLSEVLAPLRVMVYDELVSRLIDQEPEVSDLEGASGASYQIEVEGFWDDAAAGHIRVVAGIDDGGWRAFVPICDGFIKAPDGSFVGG